MPKYLKKVPSISVGFYSKIVLIAFLGLISFLLIASSFSFRSSVFRKFYPKKLSFAQDVSSSPTVDLKVIYKNQEQAGSINVSASETPLRLIWRTTNNPTSCKGYTSSSDRLVQAWSGAKTKSGGTFITPKLSQNKVYIFSLNCQNSSGESAGSSITINVGAQAGLVKPFVSSFNVLTPDGVTHDPSSPIPVLLGDKVKLFWSLNNLSTPYSACISSGSWPNQIKLGRDSYGGEVQIKENKIYRFSIYCSNEAGSTQYGVVLVPS